MTAGVIQIREGKIFTDGGKVLTAGEDGTGTGTGCCSCVSCEKDCLNASFQGCINGCTNWVADLGAGGWSDANCSGCNEIAGEYTLPTSFPTLPNFVCAWRYIVDDYCPCVKCPLVDPNYRFQVTLSVQVVDASYWRYICAVDISPMLTDITSKGQSQTVYVSSLVGHGQDCLFLVDESGRITLTKDSETHTTAFSCGGTCHLAPCSGSLPSTITIIPA